MSSLCHATSFRQFCIAKVRTFILAVAVHDGCPVVADLPNEFQGGLGDERFLGREVFDVDYGQPRVGNVVIQVAEKGRGGADLLGAFRLQEIQDVARTFSFWTAQTSRERHAQGFWIFVSHPDGNSSSR